MECYPENAWPGIEAAVRAGACWVEFDVQMCGDGTLILLHDDDFERTAAQHQSVFDTDRQQIVTVSVHEPARFGDRFSPTAVPILETMLVKLSGFPGVRAMVEIKRESLDHWGVQKVMDSLLKILSPFQKQCVLISFSKQALVYAKQFSSVDIGWVLDCYDTQHLEQANSLNPHYLICNHTRIPSTENPWTGNWSWMLYDITDPELALHWSSRGVDLIETRDISAMLKHPRLAKRACGHGDPL